MAALTTRRIARRLSHERGFTLVELLIGMAAGLVVSTGLFTILDVTLHQTTRTFSRVDATQRARVALDTIGNEMHSACVEDQVRPVKTGSTASSVTFVSQYGNSVNLTPIFHRITFDPNAATLTDTTLSPTDDPGFTDDAPNWKPGASQGTTTLLTNVAQSGTTPVFQYFKSDTTGQVAVVPGAAGLTETESEAITEVRMTIVVKPAGGSNEDVNLTPNTVTNSAVLRMTPIPNPGSPGKDFYPCA
jgi:prepilin-type N-terminal cleavage/methylation domain-containing protein